jgi:uncharacterized protein YkwD
LNNKENMRILAALTIVLCIPFSLLAQSPVPMIENVSNAIVEQTNEFRKEHEMAALATDDALTKAAKNFAEYMARTTKYGHRVDGRTPAQRVKAAGYKFCVVRENIAYRTHTGEATAESLIDVFVHGWIDSPPHRENMLAEYVTETGVAVATTDDVTYYAVQLFGRPKSESLRIEVRNESKEGHVLVIETDESSDETELAPRMVVKMSRCSPATLRIAGRPESIMIDESADVVIDATGLRRVEP